MRNVPNSESKPPKCCNDTKSVKLYEALIEVNEIYWAVEKYHYWIMLEREVLCVKPKQTRNGWYDDSGILNRSGTGEKI